MTSAVLAAKNNAKMKRMMSKKSHSWWWDSHISPKNSKWLADNLEDMDRLVKEMLKLIEEDGDSFAKKAEMYYKKRPQLVSHVEDFYRMYRGLAERYDHVTGELRKNMQSDIHSQNSWSGSDFGSEPPSPSLPPEEHKPAVHKPGARAAGFEFFLGTSGSSDMSKKGTTDASSSTSSDSDSDSDSVNDATDGISSQLLQQRILELESELSIVKGENSKIVELENECQAANEKFENSKLEIMDLQQKLQEKNESSDILVSDTEIEGLKELIASKDQEIELYKLQIAEESEKFTKEKLYLEEQVENLKSEVSKVLQQMKETEAMKQQVIEELKVAAGESADRFSLDISVLRSEISVLSAKLMESESEKATIFSERDKHITMLNKEIDGFKLQVDTLTAEKDELTARISALNDNLKDRDECIHKIEDHMQQLHLEHVKLISELEEARRVSSELKERVMELDQEVEKQRSVILDGNELKREAIRQLCFSLEHYRDGYRLLRQMLQDNKKRLMMVA